MITAIFSTKLSIWCSKLLLHAGTRQIFQVHDTGTKSDATASADCAERCSSAGQYLVFQLTGARRVALYSKAVGCVEVWSGGSYTETIIHLRLKANTTPVLAHVPVLDRAQRHEAASGQGPSDRTDLHGLEAREHCQQLQPQAASASQGAAALQTGQVHTALRLASTASNFSPKLRQPLP